MSQAEMYYCPWISTSDLEINVDISTPWAVHSWAGLFRLLMLLTKGLKQVTAIICRYDTRRDFKVICRFSDYIYHFVSIAPS